MKVWVVYFRGEAEYATKDFADAAERAHFLHTNYGGEVEIRQEVLQ